MSELSPEVLDAEAALKDMLQWVAALAKGQGDATHKIVMESPRMTRAIAALYKLREPAAVPQEPHHE